MQDPEGNSIAVSSLPLRWLGPVFGASGFGVVGRNLVDGIMAAGFPLDLALVADCPTSRVRPSWPSGTVVSCRAQDGSEFHMVSPAGESVVRRLLTAVNRAVDVRTLVLTLA
jgi:hypothetical protein